MTFDTSVIDTIPDGGPLETAWSDLAKEITQVRQGYADAKTAFAALNSQLQVGGSVADIYAAMNEPDKIAGNVDTSSGRVGKAVATYVKALRRFTTWRGNIHRDIADFHRRWPDGPPEDVIERLRWNWESSTLKADILNLEDAFHDAEDTASDTITYTSLWVPAAAPLYYPGGAYRNPAELADVLARALVAGTSDNPGKDFSALLELLSRTSPAEIAALAAAFPELNMVVPPIGRDPNTNRAWWDGRTQEMRDALTQHAPGIVGNMEGLTYADRARANRINLDLMLARAKEQTDGTRNWGLTEKQLRATRTSRTRWTRLRSGRRSSAPRPRWDCSRSTPSEWTGSRSRPS